MREICKHDNEINNCKECDATAIIKELLNVMPVLPKEAYNILGFKERYDKAISSARHYIKLQE